MLPPSTAVIVWRVKPVPLANELNKQLSLPLFVSQRPMNRMSFTVPELVRLFPPRMPPVIAAFSFTTMLHLTLLLWRVPVLLWGRYN